jgi:glyoxylase-like metal-dependent hydrolase (beta-lactamase superfamily II)
MARLSLQVACRKDPSPNQSAFSLGKQRFVSKAAFSGLNRRTPLTPQHGAAAGLKCSNMDLSAPANAFWHYRYELRGDSMALHIATRWFEFERMTDGVTRIWEPHVIRVMQCNIWHVAGRDRDLLIDTGMGIASLREAAAEIFQKPLIAAATHTHLDHVGSLHEFPERIVHAAEAQTLARASENFSMLREDHPVEFITGLERAGYEVGPRFVTAVPRADFDMRNFSCPAALPTRVVEAGDVIDLGNRVFEVLHLPGHSPGSIGLFETATGIFFSGDAIYDGPLLDELPGSDIATYINTMRRLLKVPARVVHAGHDPSFDGARLRELARAYLDRRW